MVAQGAQEVYPVLLAMAVTVLLVMLQLRMVEQVEMAVQAVLQGWVALVVLQADRVPAQAQLAQAALQCRLRVDTAAMVVRDTAL